MLVMDTSLNVENLPTNRPFHGRYVKNIIHEVGVPPFGKMEVGITINNRMIYASRPALNSVPIVKNVRTL